MSILNFIPGVAEIKTGVTIAAVMGLLGGVGYVAWQLRDLKQERIENTQLKADVTTLKANAVTQAMNMATCTSTNAANQITIAALVRERQDAQEAVEQLADEAKSDSTTITALQTKLSALRQLSANDGTLSADLKETIRGIQGVK